MSHNIHDCYFNSIYLNEVLIGGVMLTRNTLKIERHYGNKKLETIMENLVLTKLSNFKVSNEANENTDYNIDKNKTDFVQGKIKNE